MVLIADERLIVDVLNLIYGPVWPSHTQFKVKGLSYAHLRPWMVIITDERVTVAVFYLR